eukprot:11190080-Lingulodinium_polyedra.AAC.2
MIDANPRFYDEVIVVALTAPMVFERNLDVDTQAHLFSVSPVDGARPYYLPVNRRLRREVAAIVGHVLGLQGRGHDGQVRAGGPR